MFKETTERKGVTVTSQWSVGRMGITEGSHTICPGSGTDLRIPSACRMFWFCAIASEAVRSGSGRPAMEVVVNESVQAPPKSWLGAQDKSPPENAITCPDFVP